MWKIKHFKYFSDQVDWINANQHRYVISQLFVNNGYAVEYKPLRRAY